MGKLLNSSLIGNLGTNIIIFIFFSLIITYLSTKLPDKVYFYKKWIYKERPWERRGNFYQDVFKVKLWKDRLPELSDFVKSIFPKKVITEYSRENLSVYLIESCKAELTHFAIILSSLLFPLWTDPLVSMLMFSAAFILNIPFIIIQRYNRPRIITIMKHKGYEV